MYKFLYFGKWYCSGLSLDEITRKFDNCEEIWAYSINEAGKVARALDIDLNNPDSVSVELVKYTHDTETARHSCDTKSEIIKKYK